MTTKCHEFGTKSPSVVTLRKLLREYAKAGHTLVIFERGEQQSEFVRVDSGRWYHRGNGLLRAGYRLANILDAEYFEARDAGKPFKL